MKIRKHLQKELEKFPVNLKLVPIVGNGLTALASKRPYFWSNWASDALKSVGDEAGKLNALKRHGYDLPEIFSYAFDKTRDDAAGQRVIWKPLIKEVKKLTPTPLHYALACLASEVVTTNYDTLLERAAVKIRRYDPSCVFTPFGAPPELKPINQQVLSIFKLHGTLPIPNLDGNTSTYRFAKWLRDQGFEETITTSDDYRNLALKSDSALTLLLRFRSLLESSDRVFLFLGSSLTAAEVVLMRMLYNRRANYKNLYAFQIINNSDPLYRLQELGIQSIRMPIGLASGARRMLAHIVLLEMLSNRIKCPDKRRSQAKTMLLKALDRLKENRLVNKKLHQITPVVGCVGQLAMARVVALDKPARQEMFHSACTGTAKPHSIERVLLISDQSSGQAGTPVLVWNALGLPCSIVSEVGDDNAGDEIMETLSRTEWIDFSGVKQILPTKNSEASPSVASENYFCTTWFGLRTGFDSRRFEKEPREEADFSILNESPILYATKTFKNHVMKAVPGMRRKPLIVFETGTGGDWKTERWVAENRGIILASVQTANRWLKVKRGRSVADEYGRYRELKEFWNNILKAKEFPNPDLKNSRALVVTLGELGSVYWYQQSKQWFGPRWCVSKSYDANGEFSILPFTEIRDGLGCGDCARAGFVYSLARSIGFDWLSPREDLQPSTIHLAVSYLNWFGLQKVRYFGLPRFIEFLRESAFKIYKHWAIAADQTARRHVLPNRIYLGKEDFETMLFSQVNPATLANYFDTFFEKNKLLTEKFDRRIKKWSKARNLEAARRL